LTHTTAQWAGRAPASPRPLPSVTGQFTSSVLFCGHLSITSSPLTGCALQPLLSPLFRHSGWPRIMAVWSACHQNECW